MKTPQLVFTGVGVALATIFTGDDRIDVDATADLALRTVDCGLDAVVVAGSTGEAATLSRMERSELTRAVVAAVGSRVPVLAGTGAPSAHQAIELSRDAVEAGATALLVISPPDPIDLVAYYGRVAAAVPDIPLLAYHFPYSSAPGIPTTSVPDLGVCGIKDSSGDASRLLHTLEIFDGAVYTGAVPLLAMAGGIGASGAILALANAHPELCKAAFSGDWQAQRELAPLHRNALVDRPHGLKRMISERFHTCQHVRKS